MKQQCSEAIGRRGNTIFVKQMNSAYAKCYTYNLVNAFAEFNLVRCSQSNLREEAALWKVTHTERLHDSLIWIVRRIKLPNMESSPNVKSYLVSVTELSRQLPFSFVTNYVNCFIRHKRWNQLITLIKLLPLIGSFNPSRLDCFILKLLFFIGSFFLPACWIKL